MENKTSLSSIKEASKAEEWSQISVALQLQTNGRQTLQLLLNMKLYTETDSVNRPFPWDRRGQMERRLKKAAGRAAGPLNGRSVGHSSSSFTRSRRWETKSVP